ncbi:MAG: hypothetical protein ACXU8U_07800 [Asticcacaulis sp.]
MPDKPAKPWFRPKRFGYGSGLPIAWQGWVVYGAYLLITVGTASILPLMYPDPDVFGPAIAVVVIAASFVLSIICARKTEGGWRWRNGK